ncbi:hypothetical protein [Flavobacterium sp. GSA192]|uniref:hypothetical protein n=1 Tax=Flavobacterium sp. GSA192 TaxID=2576304 RepID=UPI0011264CB3|nr:hypothetical protein [Flavobacterium sp. GSA192]
MLSNNILDFENDKLNFDCLFQLLKLGVIDRAEKNRYSLSTTSIITNTKNNFAIGVNLPEEILKKNNHLIKKQYLGLTIFEEADINTLDYEVNKMVFVLNNGINLLQPVKTLIKKWESVDFNDLGLITKVENYNSDKCTWEKSNDSIKNNKLYKCYLHNGNYFKYLFINKNKCFLIEPDEYEKTNTLKLRNSNKSLFKYNRLSGEIKLKSYYTYPVYLYKIMLLNHIMQTGDIPINNQFRIELKQFLKISKILNLNYILE